MSFILDALKKLERKRQRGSVPDLTAIHFPELKELRKRPVWPYYILAVLILNAVVLSLWLRPWKSAKQDIVAKPAAEISMKQSANKPVTTSNIASQEIKNEPIAKEAQPKKQLPANMPEQKTPAKELPATRPQANIKEVTKIPNESQLPKTTSSKPLAQQENTSIGVSQSHEDNKPALVNGIPELNQLPQAIQSELPQLNIAGHIYSNSTETRLININGDIFREGDTVVKNLKVDEITENGVILNYNGTRFRLRAF